MTKVEFCFALLLHCFVIFFNQFLLFDLNITLIFMLKQSVMEKSCKLNIDSVLSALPLFFHLETSLKVVPIRVQNPGFGNPNFSD